MSRESSACQEVLRVIPLTLKEANSLVADLHRHHKPAVGHRFSLGVLNTQGTLVGAAIVGRPVARGFDWHTILEVNRLVTDGTCNSASALYGAARRVAKEMGFDRILTYILESEPGTTLKASGWVKTGETQGGSWNAISRPRTDKAPTVPKQRYEACLRGCP